MYNDNADRKQVTSPKLCKVDMIGLYRLWKKTDAPQKGGERVQKASDAFCPFCAYHIQSHSSLNDIICTHLRLALYFNIGDCFFLSLSAKEMWNHGEKWHGKLVKKGNLAAVKRK